MLVASKISSNGFSSGTADQTFAETVELSFAQHVSSPTVPSIATLQAVTTAAGGTYTPLVRLSGLYDPDVDTDAATKGYVDTELSGLGLTWLEPVVATSVQDRSITVAVNDVDGYVTLVAGDRILLKDQVVSAENGIYLFQATGQPLVPVSTSTGDVVLTINGDTNDTVPFTRKGQSWLTFAGTTASGPNLTMPTSTQIAMTDTVALAGANTTTTLELNTVDESKALVANGFTSGAAPTAQIVSNSTDASALLCISGAASTVSTVIIDGGQQALEVYGSSYINTTGTGLPALTVESLTGGSAVTLNVNGNNAVAAITTLGDIVTTNGDITAKDSTGATKVSPKGFYSGSNDDTFQETVEMAFEQNVGSATTPSVATFKTHTVNPTYTPLVRISGVYDPAADTDAATKGYVDAVASGLSWLDPAQCATTGSIDILIAPAQIDTHTLVLGDRILVKDQTTASENGVYVFQSVGTPLVLADATEAGDAILIINGAVNASSAYTATDATTWVRFSDGTHTTATGPNLTMPTSTQIAMTDTVALAGTASTETLTLNVVDDSRALVVNGNSETGGAVVTQAAADIRGFSDKGSALYVSAEVATDQPAVSISGLNSTDSALYVDGQVRVTGDSFGLSWQTPSDRRLKRNIEDIEDAPVLLKKIRPVYFNWEDKTKGERRVSGVIAQEVREHIPDCVVESNGGSLSVDYTYFTGLLMAGYQSMEKELTELRADVKRLKEE